MQAFFGTLDARAAAAEGIDYPLISHIFTLRG